MYMLRLNRMTDAKCEWMTDVAYADTKEQLLAFLDRERVEYYQDDQWGKVYRKGGPLEWFNPPTFDEESFVEIMTPEQWMQRYYARLEGLMRVT